jgi:hypothetical protein
VRERRRRVGTAASFVIGLLLLGALVLAPSASAFVYWANGGSTDGSNIGRANNDGSGANPNFITGQREPCGLAVDSQHIYWGNEIGGSIGRANLDGSGVNPNFITGALLPCGVALEGNHIWWTNESTSLVPPLQTGQVAVANLDGSDPHVMYANPFVEGPRGVGVGSGLVFWTNSDASPPSIGRAGVDGTPPPTKNFITLPDSFRPIDWPTVSGTRLYLATFFGIATTDLNGGSGASIYSNAFGGIAVHGSQVYWANLTEGTISRANADLSSPDFAFIRGLGKPTGIAVDDGATAPAPPARKKCKKQKKKRSAAAAKKHKKCKKKKRK